MERPDFIPLRHLTRIVQSVAAQYGFECPSRDRLSRMYNASRYTQLPIIVDSERGRLWVDKYYIAFRLGESDIRYVYISKHHIYEEQGAFSAAAKARGIRSQIPRDVLDNFRVARKYMAYKGRHYWVEKIYE